MTQLLDIFRYFGLLRPRTQLPQLFDFTWFYKSTDIKVFPYKFLDELS